MSNEKFTKGEWFIEKDANYSDDCWAISVKQCDNSVHHCFAEVVYKMEHEDCNLELEANAHLIAAAPELYELLSSVSDLLDYADYQSGGNIGSKELVKDARSVLAKARGEI